LLSGSGLCEELITRPKESYRLCCVAVCDLETSGIGAPCIYIYDISHLRVNLPSSLTLFMSLAVISYTYLSIHLSYKNTSLNMKRINLKITKLGFTANMIESTAYILHRTPLTQKVSLVSNLFLFWIYLMLKNNTGKIKHSVKKRSHTIERKIVVRYTS
jgi:hypothetical protein